MFSIHLTKFEPSINTKQRKNLRLVFSSEGKKSPCRLLRLLPYQPNPTKAQSFGSSIFWKLDLLEARSFKCSFSEAEHSLTSCLSESSSWQLARISASSSSFSWVGFSARASRVSVTFETGWVTPRTQQMPKTWKKSVPF